MKVFFAPKIFSNARMTGLVITFVASLWIQSMQAVSAAMIPPPPNPFWTFELLFDQANVATGLPFSLLPGLNGSDKTKFVNDQLINRDELIHMTAFLEGQLAIAIQFMPALVEDRQRRVDNCKFLLRRFQQIASATDSKGSKAICLEDVERLFVPSSTEKNRVGDDSGKNVKPQATNFLLLSR